MCLKGFLTGQEREELKKMHNSLRNMHLTDRIKCVLMKDLGYTYEEISNCLLLHISSCVGYVKLYRDRGLKGLLELKYEGYNGKLTEEQIEKLKEYLRKNLIGSAKEAVGWIENEFGVKYTPEGLVHLLHRIGFVYKKTKQVPAKASAEAQKDFIEKYNKLKEEMGPEDKIYFIDAVHPQHNSMPAYAWIEKGKDKEIPTNTGREKVNINGALDVQSKEVLVQESETINAQSTIKLFKQIEEENKEAKNIFVIADRAGYYRAKIVKEYIEGSIIKIVFLPPYSPNLNLIERVWKFFKKKVLRGHYYEKFIDFKRIIFNFFKNISLYKDELDKLLTERFNIINAPYFDTS